MSQINKIAVIGAGNMGSGIAQKIAQEGINVVMVDIKEELVERGINTIRQTLKEAVERKILNSEQLHDVLSRIIGTCDFEMVADADLVIDGRDVARANLDIGLDFHLPTSLLAYLPYYTSNSNHGQ